MGERGVAMKVLIVSNDRALLRHVSRFLATFGYETTQVADYERAVEVADFLSADLLLVDAAPDPNVAFELCRAVSQRHGSGRHYTLLLVDEKSSIPLLDAVEAGADDFLTRPIVYGEVLMRLHAGARAVEFQHRVSQQRRRDPVTGLLSYAAFHARLQAAGSSRSSRGEKLACAAIELDFLDRVTYQFGTQAQQDVLRQFAALLNELCENDHADLAHVGQGQFCVLLPGTTIADAAAWAEHVRTETAAKDFLMGDTPVSLTVSIGISGAEPLTISSEAILEKSRQALRAAKASGHDCVVQANQFAEEETAWKELAAPGRLFERTVARDVMLPCTVSVLVTDSIGSAESLFLQTRLASVVAVDRNEKLAGIVFAENVAEYLQSSGDPNQPVSKVMVHRVETFKENTPFADMMRAFAEKDIDMVVVVDGDCPTGVVTAASLASLSQAPEQPAFCMETPSMRSSYLQLADPFPLQSTTDTV